MRNRRTQLAVVLLTLAVLAACTGEAESDEDGPPPDDAAGALVRAMTEGDLADITVTAASEAPQRLWRSVTAGMGEATAEVTVTEVQETEDSADQGPRTATAALRLEWTFAETEQTWVQDGTVPLVQGKDGRWLVELDERALGLRRGEVLDADALAPVRGPIIGADAATLVQERPVLRFGIDKTRVRPAAQESSARALAEALDLDVDGLVDRVADAGESAFVEALVLRRGYARSALAATDGIRGLNVVADTLPLAPTREFARPVLGTVGPVTAEMVEESDGAYEAGDEAGLSGLQQRYDERLRGSPGWVVTADVGTRSRELFRVQPEDGEPLRTTLDLELQTLAERILADVGPASALVAVQPSTGDLLVVASGPGGGGLSTATVGQYAPGSSFKVVSGLALLRAGLAPASRVACPAEAVVDGKRFENYDDYPSSAIGTITLRQGFAQSCNTAFIEQRDRVRDLAGAAAALGLGTDHDLGFPAYFGQVPDGRSGAGSETAAAAALIGQGEVLASPLTMAAVAASVVDGRTVVPHLLPDVEPAAEDRDVLAPLTAREAEGLRGLMRAVVTEGSGAALTGVPGPPVLAKTGTAEFGEEQPLRTHAWMIAAQGDLAVAAFVEVGDSGSATAGPLLEEFLRAAR